MILSHKIEDSSFPKERKPERLILNCTEVPEERLNICQKLIWPQLFGSHLQSYAYWGNTYCTNGEMEHNSIRKGEREIDPLNGELSSCHCKREKNFLFPSILPPRSKCLTKGCSPPPQKKTKKTWAPAQNKAPQCSEVQCNRSAALPILTKITDYHLCSLVLNKD